MNKQQRLRNTADGFMAALVVNGFRGPWRWNNLDWELPFYRAWRDWAPQQRDPSSFPTFELGGSGTSSQARELLWTLKKTSPFHDYRDELTDAPHDLTPVEFLEISGEGASPKEWVELAASFLEGMNARG